MSESDCYAGEFTDREIDAVADAGDFYLDESGFFLMPTQEEMRKLVDEGIIMLTCELLSKQLEKANSNQCGVFAPPRK
jgi:hypothetical protein